MTRDELEWNYLNGFKRTLVDFPDGPIEKGESPDFRITTKDAVLGVELTRLFRKPSPGQISKAQENLREQILREAGRRYDQMSMPTVFVSVIFNNQPALKKSSVAMLAQCLLDLAIRLMPPPGGRNEEEYTWFNRARFPEHIAQIAVARHDFLTKTSWTAPSGGYLPTLSPPDIQHEIEKKNEKLILYRKTCERVWLVLCSHGEGLSSYFELSDEAKTSVYTTGFERIFFFKWPAMTHEFTK